MARSLEEGLDLVDQLSNQLDTYASFHATRADLLRRLGRPCRAAYERALELEPHEPARRFLERRWAEAGRQTQTETGTPGSGE